MSVQEKDKHNSSENMITLPEQYQWLLEWQNLYVGMALDYQQEWKAYRFLLNGKMFAMIGQNKDGLDILTVKGYPEQNEQYRTMYESIVSGYYMNKEHWISIRLHEREVDDEFIHARLLDSYQLIFQKLPKKIRDMIEQGTNK